MYYEEDRIPYDAPDSDMDQIPDNERVERQPDQSPNPPLPHRHSN